MSQVLVYTDAAPGEIEWSVDTTSKVTAGRYEKRCSPRARLIEGSLRLSSEPRNGEVSTVCVLLLRS